MLQPIAPRLGPGLHGDAALPAATRAAQPRLSDGRLLDEHVGYRYAILADKAFVEQLPAATRAMIETEIVLIIAEGDAASYLQDLNTLAVIIRPDRHILGTAVTLQQLYTVLDRRRPQTWFDLERTHLSTSAAL